MTFPSLDGVIDFRPASLRPSTGWTLEGFERMYAGLGDCASIFEWDGKRGIPPQATVYKYERIKGWILETMRPPAGGRVLDVGSGNGYFLMEIAERFQDVNPAVSYIGLDVSTHNIVHLTRRLRQAEHARVSAVLGTGESLPFESNSIDVVVSCEVIEHVADKDAMIEEVYRVLVPGGVFLFTTPSKQALRNWRILMAPVILARRLAQLRIKASPRPDVYDVPLAASEYRDKLTRTGFRSVDLQSAQLLNNHVAMRLPGVAVGPYVSLTRQIERFATLRAALGIHITGRALK